MGWANLHIRASTRILIRLNDTVLPPEIPDLADVKPKFLIVRSFPLISIHSCPVGLSVWAYRRGWACPGFQKWDAKVDPVLVPFAAGMRVSQ